MRFGYVTEQIAIGGAINELPTYYQMQKWLNGITHIICLTRLCEHRLEYFEKAGHNIEILHYYLHDDGKEKPYRYWATHVEYALDVLKNPTNKLLIHCAAGRNRSTSIAYAVLLALGMPVRKAKKTILKNYADRMYEQEKHINHPGRYKKLEDIRYKDQVDKFYSVWSKR